MNVPEVQMPHARERYTYRCKYCGYECRKALIAGTDVPVVKTGSYGDGTPSTTTFADEMYESTTISFTAESGLVPAYMTDSLSQFGDKHFSDGMVIRVETTSGTNDGDYTIATRGVTRSTVSLVSTQDFTTESAATAGTVTLSRIINQPNIGSGCPFCGSLNSR